MKKKIQILCVITTVCLIVHISCSGSEQNSTGKALKVIEAVSEKQYENDKIQISNYVLNNIEYYRFHSELCDSMYRDYANFFNPYAHFYDKNKESLVIATIPVSQYLNVTVDTIIYDDNGLKCFIFCGIEIKTMSINGLTICEKGRNFDAKSFVGVRNNIADSISIYPFVKYSIFGYGNFKEAVDDLKYLYFNKLKGDNLSASHYSPKGFEQNVGDDDFFEKSIIFQHFDDSTFNYQYCYYDLIKYPFMK